ncbi:hypothetical protein [Zunongwangia sp. HRR-M8]|uniref:hypothetical protein n=1 Tax=Zunongwangia sp. HRR-M8 TaxID=3015170 RepID=UPI0022DD8A47|nr:hypothetical protein [Zunongwangia sp. HRR-M8]WBL21492.1 hypothetical protein PBT89_12170 [Zunongwangia sp. HRR-M8]
MNYRILPLYAVVALLSFSSCKNNEKNKEKKNKTEESFQDTESQNISIEPLKESPAYEDSGLSLVIPENNQFTKNTVEFKFNVDNYQLGAQTTKNEITSRLANSDKGQHIHFIVDNEPYSAHYETEFSKDFSEGTHHIVAFLSRSYHESVKNDQSFITKTVKIGSSPDERSNVDFTKPTLIYSRPKGEYSGKDIENLLLDFFLLNTTLSENGNYVKATINGETFKITKWQPYIIKGLSKGQIDIRLQLFDNNDQPIKGEYNDVTRSVLLK